ncbi:MAG: hypothetical protein CVT88_07095 [Candidatus Altiarchaeales archaeon HGW-Altiarchaeales-1]|nr:MAG: hypothetical protein CVT89_05920 [Candidatus Altiarchaeales archaeon HGW-Altiarchaeales-2]PKP58539.1 MAG: hypothetical protein CVT88_07095 [Candidatus Altiarchaeales archaeon HGW-Altiarchaeales-1]
MPEENSLLNVYKNFKAEPLKTPEEFSKFYVERPIKSTLMKELKTKIENAERGKFLFIGHRGSGKSTELNKLSSELEENFLVIRYSIKENLDMNDITIKDFLLSLGLKIYELGEQNNIEFSTELKDDFMRFVRETTHIKEKEIKELKGAGLSFTKIFMAKIGIESQTKDYVREELKTKITDLVRKINNLIAVIENLSNKKILIVVDDTDKLTRYEQAEDLFYKNYSLLLQIDCNVIYTFPIPLVFDPYFESVQNKFDGICVLPQPAVKSKNLEIFDDDGINFFKNIFYKRVNERKDTIDENTLEYAIISTGKLSEFVNVIRDALIKSTVKGKTKIEKEEIEECASDLRGIYEKALTQKHISTLLEIHETKHASDKSPEEKIVRDMLFSLIIVEYENKEGKRWHEINPILFPLIDKWKNILQEKQGMKYTL